MTDTYTHHLNKSLQISHIKGFPDGPMVKNPPAMQEPQATQVQFLGQEDPLKEGTATHSSILLPGESQGQGSLVGYSP